jgi:hypothetical protein
MTPAPLMTAFDRGTVVVNTTTPDVLVYSGSSCQCVPSILTAMTMLQVLSTLKARPRKADMYYRHRLPVRIMHWVNVVCLTVLFMSGLSIFNAHSALYWGNSSYDGHPALLEITSTEASRPPGEGGAAAPAPPPEAGGHKKNMPRRARAASCVSVRTNSTRQAFWAFRERRRVR